MATISMREMAKRHVSMDTRRKLAFARVSVRKRTAHLRPLPNLLIIGTQRGGTSSLFKYLSAHPDCRASIRKEIRFFTEYYAKGEDWYRAHFALGRVRYPGSAKVAFDATPDYMLDPRTPRRAAALLPDARVLVLLREPAERALSHFNHNRRLGLENRTFEQALRLETQTIGPDLIRIQMEPNEPIGKTLLRYSYLERGKYGEQLERWLSAFDSSRFLVLRSEDLFLDTNNVFHKILSFVGVKEWRPREFRNYSYSRNRRPSETEVPAAYREMIDQKLSADQNKLSEILARLCI